MWYCWEYHTHQYHMNLPPCAVMKYETKYCGRYTFYPTRVSWGPRQKKHLIYYCSAWKKASRVTNVDVTTELIRLGFSIQIRWSCSVWSTFAFVKSLRNSYFAGRKLYFQGIWPLTITGISWYLLAMSCQCQIYREIHECRILISSKWCCLCVGPVSCTCWAVNAKLD